MSAFPLSLKTACEEEVSAGAGRPKQNPHERGVNKNGMLAVASATRFQSQVILVDLEGYSSEGVLKEDP